MPGPSSSAASPPPARPASEPPPEGDDQAAPGPEPARDDFRCNVCGSRVPGHEVGRGDGRAVLFCAECGMGVVAEPPASTEGFYADGYYGAAAPDGPGYRDYEFTAEHALLWARLFVETLKPRGGRILDVGCADGFLLGHLRGPWQRFGIEVNATAAATAAARGVSVVASDVADPRLAAGEWGRFDVVTSLATFEHVLDLRGAVSTCLDLLAPDGVLIFEVPLISETADNKDWFHGSYEHIHYPTERGLKRLFDGLPGVGFAGVETDIRGFSASYIGVAARDPDVFERAERLLRAMTGPTLDALSPPERRLNLAYHVVHGFRPTPERVLALPELLEAAATTNLLKRLTQLWHNDSARAEAAAFHEQQARNWMEEAARCERAASDKEREAEHWKQAYARLAGESFLRRMRRRVKERIA